MRFVWAVAAFVLAAVMIAAGIAQRTVLQGPKTETTEVSSSSSAAYTLIDGDVLTRMSGAQTLRAAADGEVFAAYGRTADMKAWLSDATYNEVTLDRSGDVKTKVIAPTAEDADGKLLEEQHRDPAGSDLWLDEFTQKDILIQHLQLPDTMSVLVATDGTASAPKDVSVTWTVHRSTPWAGPLIVAGGILMVIGGVLYVLGVRNARRSRGPRRKAMPPLPETEASDISVAEADKGVISAGDPKPHTRRAVAVVPALLVSSLLFAGCTADAWPQLAPSVTPSPTPTVVDPAGAEPPAVTAGQADRIIAGISRTVQAADEKNDESLAATRLDGAALAERATNYALRTAIPDEQALPAIPATGLRVVLPQAYEGWPRTVMLIAEKKAEKTVTSTIMMIAQQDPWSPYRLSYVGQLEAAAIPDVAPTYVGAAAVQPDSSFLVVPPDQLAAAYADVMDNGDKSPSAGLFDVKDDVFLKGVADKRTQQLDEFNQTAAQTGQLTFAASESGELPLALATLESGAIVAVSVHETETVKPTDPDAVIKLDNNPRVQALTGVKESQTGFTTTYGDQLFFYVPGVGAGKAQIRLLGYSSSILGAKVADQ